MHRDIKVRKQAAVAEPNLAGPVRFVFVKQKNDDVCSADQGRLRKNNVATTAEL